MKTKIVGQKTKQKRVSFHLTPIFSTAKTKSHFGFHDPVNVFKYLQNKTSEILPWLPVAFLINFEYIQDISQVLYSKLTISANEQGPMLPSHRNQSIDLLFK